MLIRYQSTYRQQEGARSDRREKTQSKRAVRARVEWNAEALEGRVLLSVLSFAAPQSYSTGASPLSIVMGDFNGDGKRDLIIASPSTNTVSVRLGDGIGAFGNRVDYATGTCP